jgi:Carbonic anhydrase
MKTIEYVLAERDLTLISAVSKEELEERLLAGTSTGVAIIACSEMDDVFAEMPRISGLPVFVWQNVGATVHEADGLGHLVASGKVSNLVIYGHYPCDLIHLGVGGQHQFEFEPDELVVDHFLYETKRTREMVKERYGDGADQFVIRKATEDFLLRQVESLLEIPEVLDAAIEQGLRIHAWMNLSESHECYTFDPATKKFR